MPTPRRRESSSPSHFTKAYPVLKINEELGLVYGWAAICSEDGVDYFDTQGDHIGEAAAEVACLDFMKNSRVSTDLHVDEDGVVPFLLPLLSDTCEALGIETTKRGVAIGMQPSADVFAKFQDGTYTGFSIGGVRLEEEVVEKVAKSGHLDNMKGKKQPRFRQGKKRRMLKLRIDEIAAADIPAQSGALAVLLKRKGSAPSKARKGDQGDFVDSEIAKRGFLTTAVDGHTHLAIVDFEHGEGAKATGTTTWADDHDHPWLLKADGDVVIGMARGHGHEADELSVSDSMAALLLRDREGDEMAKTTEQLEAEVARLTKISELDGDVRKHFKALETEDEIVAFLKLTPDAQEAATNAAIEKRNAVDPIVYTSPIDGTEIRKSDGATTLALAKRADKQAAKIDDLTKRTTESDYQKRARTELPHLAGTEIVKGRILEVVELIEDEGERAEALKSLTAADLATKSTFNTVGEGNREPEEIEAGGEIEKRAAEIRKADPAVTKAAALIQAEDELPEVAETIRKAHDARAVQRG